MAVIQRQCSLPSHRSAVRFIQNPSLKTTKALVGSYFGRASLLTLGFLVAGKGARESVSSGVIGATTIELFVLLHALEMIRDGRCA